MRGLCCQAVLPAPPLPAASCGWRRCRHLRCCPAKPSAPSAPSPPPSQHPPVGLPQELEPGGDHLPVGAVLALLPADVAEHHLLGAGLRLQVLHIQLGLRRLAGLLRTLAGHLQQVLDHLLQRANVHLLAGIAVVDQRVLALAALLHVHTDVHILEHDLGRGKGGSGGEGVGMTCTGPAGGRLGGSRLPQTLPDICPHPSRTCSSALVQLRCCRLLVMVSCSVCRAFCFCPTLRSSSARLMAPSGLSAGAAPPL